VLVCVSSIVKASKYDYCNHAQIYTWIQPAMRNEGKVSCAMKQQEPSMRLELTADRHTSVLTIV